MVRMVVWLLFALATLPVAAAPPCEAEYGAALQSAAHDDQWMLQRAWSRYLTGRAESSEALLATLGRMHGAHELRRDFHRENPIAELARCVRKSTAVDARPLTIRVFSGPQREPLGGVRVSVDGEIVGFTDDFGSLDTLATPRTHVVTATEAWGGASVTHMVEVRETDANVAEFDLSMNHGSGNGGRFTLESGHLTAGCEPFSISYFDSYIPARLAAIERAFVSTPSEIVDVSDLVRIKAARQSIEVSDCPSLFARIEDLAPPHVLYLRATAESGALYETRAEPRAGFLMLRVGVTSYGADTNVSVRERGSDQTFFQRVDTRGVASFGHLPRGDYVVGVDEYPYYARELFSFHEDAQTYLVLVPRPVAGCFRQRSSDPESLCEGDREAHVLLFRFDDAEHFAPLFYRRANRNEMEFGGASLFAFTRAEAMNEGGGGWTKFVEAELLDDRGRVAFRRVVPVAVAVEAPGGPWLPLPPEGRSFTLTVPASFATRLRLRGWLPQMRATFELRAIARDESLR